jgi:MFS family permease
MYNPKKLSEGQIRKTKKNSVIDGSAYSVMYGFGEQYVTPFAIRLGATNSEIGILASVPSFIGALFQIVGAKLTDNWKDRKKIVTWFVLLQSFILLPLFIVPFFTKSVLLLTIIFTVYMVCANIMGPPWSSWIGDVIPENQRGNYFGLRNKIVIGTMMFSVLFAGLILTYFENINIWTGFGILFTIAFIGRLVSWSYLRKQYEPQYVIHPNTYFSLKDFIKKMPETNFGNFVIFRSLIAFAVMIAAPFFAAYMLKNLGFNYIEYTLVVLAPMLVKSLTMTYWGKYSNRFGTRNILIVSAFLIATIPIWWFFSGYFFEGKHFLLYILLVIEGISGFAWAGFELTTFNYILETVKPEKRPRCFAYFNVIFGTAVLLGGLLGSYLVAEIKPLWGVKTLLIVFFISFIARMTIAIILSSRIKEVKVNTKIDGTKLFFDMILARPLNEALHHTHMTLILAEQEMEKISLRTQNVFTTASKPIQPHVTAVINTLDKGLDKIEPIRKNIIPKAIAKKRKERHDQLINSGFNKKMSKIYVRKGVRRKR